MKNQSKLTTIQEMEMQKPQVTNKYRIYKAFTARDGDTLYNFSKLFKRGWRLGNDPFSFKSDADAKRQALKILKLTGEKITLRNIEVISLLN